MTTETKQFVTPKGNTITLSYRANSIDAQIIEQTVSQDEYSTKELSLSGLALDLGAYIGSVAIMLAADNPKLQVIAVEPIPENAALLRTNISANALYDRVSVGHRVSVVQAAVGVESTKKTLPILYAPDNPRGYIGYAGRGNAQTINARLVTLAQLCGDTIPTLVKMDIEWGEYDILGDPLCRAFPLIIGEYHPICEDALTILQGLLISHDFSFTGRPDWCGLFKAIQNFDYQGMAIKDTKRFVQTKADITPLDVSAMWPRCLADTIEVAARWIACGAAAEVDGKPITREYALECLRQAQRELHAMEPK